MVISKLISTGLLIVGLNCPEPLVENHTERWTEMDQETFDRAKTRCSEIYSDAPCLKKFIKKDDTTYNVVCGRGYKIYE